MKNFCWAVVVSILYFLVLYAFFIRLTHIDSAYYSAFWIGGLVSFLLPGRFKTINEYSSPYVYLGVVLLTSVIMGFVLAPVYNLLASTMSTEYVYVSLLDHYLNFVGISLSYKLLDNLLKYLTTDK